MKEQRQPIIRVRDWEPRYENNRSREMKDTRWFPMPNDLSADSYVELLAHPDGPAHLGVWTGLLMVASRAKPRGSLVRDDGRPHRLRIAGACDSTAFTPRRGCNRALVQNWSLRI